MTGAAPVRPVPAALAIVARGDAVLLVKRRNPPDAGRWGFPGGRIEPGETVAEAAVRELAEETGIVAEAVATAGIIDVIGRSDDGDLTHHFVLVAVACRWQSGEPAANDDALDAAWFTLAEVEDEGLEKSARVLEFARAALAAEAPLREE